MSLIRPFQAVTLKITKKINGRAANIEDVLRSRQLAVDTGGVRRQVYADAFEMNSFQKMFDGDLPCLCPVVSAQNKHLMKVFGEMLAHSIVLKKQGFHTCPDVATGR